MAWGHRGFFAAGAVRACVFIVIKVPLAFEMPEAWVTGRPHNLASMADYHAKYQESVNDPDFFWRGVANQFEWRGAPLSTTGLKYNFDKTKGKVFTEWCVGVQEVLRYMGTRSNSCQSPRARVRFFLFRARAKSPSLPRAAEPPLVSELPLHQSLPPLEQLQT